ncbi:MAG: DUF4810 domain-containing protein [Methylococcales bacterium]
MDPVHQFLGCICSQSRAFPILLLVTITGTTGCAPTSLYDWGKYEDSLYLRYTDHDFIQAESYLSNSLPTTAHPSRIPPGVYADYGFLLYRRGDYTGALQYFEKEKQTFPESSALMTKLIDRVRQKMAQTDNSKIKDYPGTGKSAP